MKNTKLWNRIESWQFPGGEGFAPALAKEFGCPEDQAAALVVEYRRYAYLAGLLKSGKRTPSSPVRRVWEAHRRDAANYTAFCDVLGKAPVPGATGASRSGHGEYATRQAYRREFGQPPPRRYWPDPNRWIFRVFAAIFVAGGLAGSLADGAIWPLLAGSVLAALILFVPKKPGKGGDDAAFMAVISND